MGWREELQDRLKPSRRAAPRLPRCAECGAERTVQTIGRALYCPICGRTWTLIDVVVASLPPTESRSMIWFFERSGQVLELETRYSSESAEYELEIRRLDIGPQTERFANGEAFRTRLIALERSLSTQRWRPNGQPLFIPDDWP